MDTIARIQVTRGRTIEYLGEVRLSAYHLNGLPSRCHKIVQSVAQLGAGAHGYSTLSFVELEGAEGEWLEFTDALITARIVGTLSIAIYSEVQRKNAIAKVYKRRRMIA